MGVAVEARAVICCYAWQHRRWASKWLRHFVEEWRTDPCHQSWPPQKRSNSG